MNILISDKVQVVPKHFIKYSITLTNLYEDSEQGSALPHIDITEEDWNAILLFWHSREIKKISNDLIRAVIYLEIPEMESFIINQIAEQIKQEKNLDKIREILNITDDLSALEHKIIEDENNKVHIFY